MAIISEMFFVILEAFELFGGKNDLFLNAFSISSCVSSIFLFITSVSVSSTTFLPQIFGTSKIVLNVFEGVFFNVVVVYLGVNFITSNTLRRILSNFYKKIMK